MKTEKSCGAVVFTREGGKLRYVIICSDEGYYGFPKGHVEGAETEHETALREIKEETGLDVVFIDGFRTVDSHPLAREGRPDVIKETVYFLAEYSGQTPHAQESEISRIVLLGYEEAMSIFQFESSRRILSEANAYLAATDAHAREVQE